MNDAAIRTVRIIARLNIGGPARHTTLLDAGLRRRGYDTLLVHGVPESSEGSLEHLVTDAGLPARRLPRLGRAVRPGDDLRTLAQIVGILREVSPDVIHTHTAKAGALGRIAAAVYNAGRRRTARAIVVHTFHGHVLEGYFRPAITTAVRRAERVLATLTDRIVAISPAQRDDLVVRFRVAPPRKVVVVPLGLDLARVCGVAGDPATRRALGVAPDAFVIGYAGRLVAIKNVPLLLEAFAGVRRVIPDARLLVAGDGPLRADVIDRVRTLGLAESVRLLGWVEDLAPLFGASDVVALTSDNEGTPVALIEAMAAGCAVVSTRAGGVPDLLVDGVTGVLVDRGNAAGLCGAFLQLAKDPALRNRLGRAAREDVRRRFDADRLVSDIDGLYRDTLAERRRA
jgi:glycosyltransferase involved in cell wall biosynthesis